MTRKFYTKKEFITYAKQQIKEKEIRNIDDIEAEFNKIKSIIRQFGNDKSRYIKNLYSFD